MGSEQLLVRKEGFLLFLIVFFSVVGIQQLTQHMETIKLGEKR